MMPLIVNDIHDSQMFALAQAAGRAGLPVIGLCPCPAAWAEASRYIERVVQIPCLGEAGGGIVAAVLKREGVKGVWLPAYDDSAYFTARYATALRAMGLNFLVADAATQERAHPAFLQDYRAGLVMPVTLRTSWRELAVAAAGFPFPAVLKCYGKQYLLAKSSQELVAMVEARTASVDLNDPVFLQAYIEGPTSKLASAMMLADGDGRVVRGFTARRQRVVLDHGLPFGETTAARAERLPDLYAAAKALLEHLAWQGFAEVECKQGADGRWYLLEINPRPSGWMCLAEADGAGLLAAYWRMCSEGLQLSPAWLQRGQASYVRAIGNRYHEPDWWLPTVAHDHPGKKLMRLGRCLRQYHRRYPNMLLGAWDGRDRRASRLLAWDGLKEMLRDCSGTKASG